MNNSTNKIAQIKGSVNRVHPKREPLSRTWFAGHGYTKIPDGILPRTYYIKVTDEHPEGIVVNEFGQQMALLKLPNEKVRKKIKSSVEYFYLHVNHKGKDRHYSMHFLVFCTFHHIPEKGKHIDHIDGDSFNNRPSNLREVDKSINDRDAGFLRKLRNHRIDVRMYPGIILEGYERMAKYKATHKKWQYEKLSRKDLLLLFVGDGFRIAEPSEIEFDEPFKYADMYER